MSPLRPQEACAQKQAAPSTPAAALPRVASEELFRGNNALEIEHAGQRYLLRVTRENKLILTK